MVCIVSDNFINQGFISGTDCPDGDRRAATAMPQNGRKASLPGV